MLHCNSTEGLTTCPQQVTQTLKHGSNHLHINTCYKVSISGSWKHDFSKSVQFLNTNPLTVHNIWQSGAWPVITIAKRKRNCSLRDVKRSVAFLWNHPCFGTTQHSLLPIYFAIHQKSTSVSLCYYSGSNLTAKYTIVVFLVFSQLKKKKKKGTCKLFVFYHQNFPSLLMAEWAKVYFTVDCE